jgi:hypothetical protein
MLDPRQRSAPAWTIHSVAIRSRDGPQRVARVYWRLLAPPRHDTAGWQRAAVEEPAEPQARCRWEMT